MGRVILTLPRLGETMEEARVTDWLVAPGADYRRGDVLLEVETDKTVVEVPALSDGRMLAQLVAPGDMVALDQPIAEVESAGAEQAASAPVPPQALPEGDAPQPMVQPTVVPLRTDRIAASPAARAAARAMGADLAQVSGSGRRGRITAQDVIFAGKVRPAVVLLHGLFDDARGWRDLPQRLEALGYATHAPDLPGHGRSPAVAATISGMADTIAADLPDGPLILIGHSLGAAVAARLARGLKGRVQQLIAIAPAGIGARINGDFIAGMTGAQTPAALARALSLLDAGPVSTKTLAQEMDRLLPLRDAQRMICDAMASAGVQQIDITEDLAALGCPTRVIFGTRDRILGWQDVENLAPHIAIHLVRGAGHLPHHAAPALIVDLLGAQTQPLDHRRPA